jgi:hypothetical protein
MRKTTVQVIIVILVFIMLASLTSYVKVMKNQKDFDKKIENYGICSVFYENQFFSEAEAKNFQVRKS